MQNERESILLQGSIGAVVLVALFFVSHGNYLLFHSLAELFSITIACTVFSIAWNSRRYLQNGYLLLIGISGLFAGFVDVLHTLAFQGMGVFGNIDANLATQLWLAARLIQSLSFLIAPLFIQRRPRDGWILLGYTLVTGVLVGLVFRGWFPAAYINNHLTAFKIYSEYLIMAFYTAGIILLVRERRYFDRVILVLLAWSIALAVFSEWAFTFYLDVTGLANFAGHCLKIVSFYLLYKALIENGVNRPYRMIFRDLKRSEEELRKSQTLLESQVVERTRALDEQRVLLESILRQAANGIIARDSQGKIIFANAIARKMLAIRDERELVIGEDTRYPSTFYSDGKEIDVRDWPSVRALQGETSVGREMRIVHPDGTGLDVIASAAPVNRPDGTLLGSVMVLADITRRRQAEEALRELNQELEQRVNERTAELQAANEALRTSEARALRLVESNIIGVMFTDEQGQILNANDALLNMIGYTREDLQAGRIHWREITPPEWLYRDEQGIQEAQARGSCTPYEKEYIRKDGSRVPILIGYAELEDSPEFICYVVDLTRQKQVEERIQHYAAELERSNRELQDFAYVASHDLQEPLRKIIAFGNRLKETAGPKLNERELDYLGRMQRASERMRAMIDDLLALSRVTTRAQPFVAVDLNEVARDVANDLEVRAEQAGARIEIGDLPTVQADRLQMHQLLQNLIGNALKFTRPDVQPIIRVYEEADGSDKARIVVADNGIGFDPQQSERIFQPFQRLHGMGQYEGSGMGLAIVQKIVQRHEGEIKVQAQPNEGATFTVTLPLYKER